MNNRLVCAQVTTAKATTQVVDGVSYLVAPVVAIKAGVLNAELVPADEIQKSVKLWNDVPIPIDHPLRDEEKISARDIEVIEKVVVGRFYDAYYEDEKLKGNLWIDIEKAKKVGGDALKALEKLQNGEPLEVSTAYYSDVSDETGVYNGVEYTGIEYNLRPDHLALLPTSIGACNWQDGCGAPRVNQEGETMPQLKVALQEGESYEMRSDAVEGAIREAVIPDGSSDWYAYIVDLFEDSVVYRVTQPDQESIYFKASYTVGSDRKVTLGDAVAVERKVEYTALKANVRGTARKPNYKGTESTPWTGPTLKKMIAGYVKHTGSDKPESSLVKDLPAGCKTWIASKTLLGDAKADNERDLTFFPCVNPGTNKLNEGALRAVLGGRGAQADIPASARDSARAKARSLLEKEFGMETQEDKLASRIVSKLKELLGVRTMSEKEKLIKALREKGVKTEEEILSNTDEGLLKEMLEQYGDNEEESPAGEGTPGEGEPSGEGEPPADPPVGNTGAEQLSASQAQELLDLLKANKDAETAEKATIVASLVANEKCLVDKEALNKMEVGVLKSLASAYEPGSYLGVGVPHVNAEEIPAAPAIVMAANKEGE